MLGRLTTILCGLALVAVLMIAIAWATSSDPKKNPASFEAEPIVVGVARADQAITLAQFKTTAGETATILVLDYDSGRVSGIDLFKLGAPRLEDPFAVLEAVTRDSLRNAAVDDVARIVVPVEQLLPAGPGGARHIGIGTNFPEHAEESSSDSVFNFPKFGAATPARTIVQVEPGVLLDYEVELCMRFDRDVSSLADFDAATKGVFLCSDFTNRTALVELVDPDNLDSGYGFSDAKSGLGFFPTGPFLVIPQDWAAFVSDVRMTTELNGEPRQDARGGEMILDFRQLTEKVLADMAEPRFFYRDEFYRLARDGRIAADMALMSGTSEGVIFTPPVRHDYIEALLTYLITGGPLAGRDLMEVAIQVFINNELASGHFLQGGDEVTYRSSALGDIVVSVVD
ncbi:MAG: hypothetical protein GXP06_12030 [Alphaproteobacteria bacterium]|nr:hypothetical protein [Alphaproteobacteria bacterium]